MIPERHLQSMRLFVAPEECTESFVKSDVIFGFMTVFSYSASGLSFSAVYP